MRLCFPSGTSSPDASFLPSGILPLVQVYPGQQYLQGGQYAPSTAQFAPSPGQPPAPSPSYPGHRLPLQQGMSQSLSVPGPTGLHYKVGQAPLGPVPGSMLSAVGRDLGAVLSSRATGWLKGPAGCVGPCVLMDHSSTGDGRWGLGVPDQCRSSSRDLGSTSERTLYKLNISQGYPVQGAAGRHPRHLNVLYGKVSSFLLLAAEKSSERMGSRCWPCTLSGCMGRVHLPGSLGVPGGAAGGRRGGGLSVPLSFQLLRPF